MADPHFCRRQARFLLVALCVLQASYAGAQTTGPASSVVSERQQVSEICSEQADALGLHDQARWNFRAHCKTRDIAESCSDRADALGLHGEQRWIFRARCKA